MNSLDYSKITARLLKGYLKVTKGPPRLLAISPASTAHLANSQKEKIWDSGRAEGPQRLPAISSGSNCPPPLAQQWKALLGLGQG